MPKIHHEEPAQHAPDHLGFGFLLVVLLGHQSRCQDRAVESEGFLFLFFLREKIIFPPNLYPIIKVRTGFPEIGWSPP
jgi:hypothetical protein